jgi:hypothetical protein
MEAAVLMAAQPMSPLGQGWTRAMMNVIFRNQLQRFTLFHVPETDEYVLTVLCGTTGLYEAQVKLTAEQAHAYRDDGPGVLEVIARDYRAVEAAKLGYRLPVDTPERKRKWWSLAR